MAKVLLVEDDNNLREIYQARLMAEGYDIVAAQNGEEALVVAKQNKPDLIISDVMMPRISGFEMLDILRNTDELKGTKVIMLTALGQAEDQTRADNLGADRYLVKSQVTLEDIVNAAKELLAGAPGTEPAEPVIADAPAPISAPVTTPEPVDPAPTAPISAPVPEPVVEPASVAPQPDVTVVVPPAPANPTPPAVTVTPMAAEPAVDPVAIAPEPVAAPAPAPAITPSDTVAASSAAVAANPQPIQTEEASVQDQINNFANQAQSAPIEVDPVQAAQTAANDEALANAVNELNSPEPATTQPVITMAAPATPAPTAEPVAPAPAISSPSSAVITAPAATAPDTPAPSTPMVSAGGTKVIQPLNPEISSAPDINALLEKEAAKEQSDSVSTVTAPAATPASQTVAPPPANIPTTPAGSVGPVAPPPAPGPNDPESIAL